jgi:hypothetical protein
MVRCAAAKPNGAAAGVRRRAAAEKAQRPFRFTLAAGGPLSDAEVERLYQQHLLETELVQIEQVLLLRCLARRHGLRTVRIEGLTAQEVTLFRKKVDALKGLEQGAMVARVQLQEVRELMGRLEAAGKKGSDRYQQAAGIEQELVGLIDQYRPDWLEVGAVGRLLLAGDIAEVLALDDERLLALARPITPDGRVHFDADTVRHWSERSAPRGRFRLSMVRVHSYNMRAHSDPLNGP